MIAARAAAVELLGGSDVPGSLKWYRFEEPVDAPAPPETLAYRLVGDGELARLDADPRPDLWERAAASWEALRFPYRLLTRGFGRPRRSSRRAAPA